MLESDNPFWRFSLAVYPIPGVAPECLALQDTQGVDVNVLLFCAWLGSAQCIVLTEEDLATIDAAVRPWRDAVVEPLRAVRRTVKTMPEATQDDVAALRRDVAALELRAEQTEQAMLYRLVPVLSAPETVSAEVAIRRNIALLLDRRTGAGSALPERLIEAALARANQP